MTQPMDPNSDFSQLPSEYCWGPGIFPPGIASNEGQNKQQDNFGDNMFPPQYMESSDSNYARIVADRRTDPTDPTSTRDFNAAGLVDRYGPNPPLVRATPQQNKSQRIEPEQSKSERRW